MLLTVHKYIPYNERVKIDFLDNYNPYWSNMSLGYVHICFENIFDNTGTVIKIVAVNDLCKQYEGKCSI